MLLDNNSLIDAFNVELFKFVALEILSGEFKNKQFEYFRVEKFGDLKILKLGNLKNSKHLPLKFLSFETIEFDGFEI